MGLFTEEAVSISEAAHIIGCSLAWAKILVAQGKLPGAEQTSLGWLVPLSSVERYAKTWTPQRPRGPRFLPRYPLREEV